MGSSDPIAEQDGTGQRIYQSLIARRYTFFVIGGVALLAIVIADVATGPSGMPFRDVLDTLFAAQNASATNRAIVWSLRLPAALMALVVGAGLGIAGTEMQTILNNPLASPYTLGIATAAGFGAALGLVLGVGVLSTASAWLVPANAFVAALLCSFAVYSVARLRGATTETLVLTGIAMHFLFSALLALLEYRATQEQLHALVFWLFGDLNKTTWPSLGVTALVLLVSWPILARDAWKLTALRLGDNKAMSLGVDVRRLRRRVLIVISALIAAATCFVGTIGFIGLVGPHVARMFVGEDQRFLVPLSALCGALLLATASVVSKNIVSGVVFPVGIVTSLVGIPFFLSLIVVRRRRHW